jgi:Reverse transcriptase (RNA-dependent DNA polymerase)
MDEASEKLTTFTCNYGNYFFRVLPFGLASASGIFEHFINNILQNFIRKKQVLCYLDDIMIASIALHENRKITKEVIETLQKNGFSAKIKKCQFYSNKVDFLCFKTYALGILPKRSSISCLYNWKEPSTLKQVQSFIGFNNYLRTFIENYG